jgi:hypothetical protein
LIRFVVYESSRGAVALEGSAVVVSYEERKGDCRRMRACPCVRELSFGLKRKKGIWWMPWHREAMKDVAPCDKLRGEGSTL